MQELSANPLRRSAAANRRPFAHHWCRTESDSRRAARRTFARALRRGATAALAVALVSIVPGCSDDSPGAPASLAVVTLTPSSGHMSGGTLVTISGTGFRGIMAVSFGGVAATNVSVISSTLLTATAPAHPHGDVDVVVANAAGQISGLSRRFTYLTENIDSGEGSWDY